MSCKQQETDPESDFTDEAVPAIIALRSTFGKVLASIQGASVGGPTQLSRILGIDSTLAWKVANFVGEVDPFRAALYAPKRAATRLFLKAAAKHGADAEALSEAKLASESFEYMVERHGGDRQSAEMMFASQDSAQTEKIMLSHRRNAYRANSMIWGIQSKAQAQAFILSPSSDAELLDVVSVKGLHQLRSIRPGVSWRLNRMSVSNEGEWRAMARLPLDPAGVEDDGGISWIREFCSKPLPAWERVEPPDGKVFYQLEPRSVGSTGSIDSFTGVRSPALTPRFASETRREMNLSAQVSLPTELFVLDVWIHHEIELGPAVLRLVSLMWADSRSEYIDSDLLPAHIEHLTEMPTGFADPFLREIPRWGELIRWSFDAVDASLDDYRLVRLRIPFPPTPTNPTVVLPLLARPQ